MDIISAENIDFYYGDFHALKGISMGIEENSVTALIGRRVVENQHFCD